MSKILCSFHRSTGSLAHIDHDSTLKVVVVVVVRENKAAAVAKTHICDRGICGTYRSKDMVWMESHEIIRCCGDAVYI